MRPEQAGIHSKYIKKYIEKLEAQHLSMHAIIIARGEDILFEKYWEPFHADYLHRMYSMSKSVTTLAVGFLEQDGMINLDDPIGKYFPEEIKLSTNPMVQRQTIRNMLMMSTARLPRNHGHWTILAPKDRVKYYFEDPVEESGIPVSYDSTGYGNHEPGSIFEYDSTGSFILGAMVERITGKSLLAYLQEKLFTRIGVSKEAYFLTCPGGHSWCDSAFMAKARDMLKIGQFFLQDGKWDGEQLLNKAYVTASTSKQIDTNVWGIENWNTFGYGYQVWRTYQNSFIFWGMGSQIVLCVPHKKLILVTNGDNQGNPYDMRILVKSFFDIVVDNMEAETCTGLDVRNSDEEGCEGKCGQSYEDLMCYADTLKLATAWGEKYSLVEEQINDITYVMDENPMGITRMRFQFNEEGGILYYTNTQGDKKLYFGRCENRFFDFPEEGYADLVGSVSVPGHKYQCAVSAAWTMSDKLFLSVQIIDKYFARLNISVGFQGTRIGVHMTKSAEGFLENYHGFACGQMK